MTSTIDDAGGSIERARDDGPAAEAAILAGHRDRLRTLVASRLDRRLAARVDPSDVVQEALADAASRLSAYLQDPPLPLLPWLYQFARQRLGKAHRQHLLAGRRSVARERPAVGSSSSRPGWSPGRDPADGGTSPSGRLIRDEDCERVRAAMGRLPEADRKILAMRHVEALSMAKIAEALGIGEGAAKVRHLRALRRLRPHLEDSR